MPQTPGGKKAPDDIEARHEKAGKLAISCFGKLSLSVDGRHIILKSKKARELIAYLICNRSRPVSKARIAEILWPDALRETANSSLNKVLRYIREFSKNETYLPIFSSSGYMWIDLEAVYCDLKAFEGYYNDRNNMHSCAIAVDLYGAPLLFDELYEWVTPYEAYYDIRYVEMLESLAGHYARLGNARLAGYYKSKTE